MSNKINPEVAMNLRMNLVQMMGGRDGVGIKELEEYYKWVVKPVESTLVTASSLQVVKN